MKFNKQKFCWIYLILIPFIAVAIAFLIGHVSYKVYLPIWVLHSLLMLTAAWILGGSFIKSDDIEKKRLAAIGLFMIIPWMFITIFTGMGPPPSTIAGWIATADEQQIRYYILILSGILIAVGFALLKKKLELAGENFYSQIGFTAISIAIPLFIINMAFWGCFLTEAFKAFGTATQRPQLYQPLKSLFYTIAIVEAALIYLGSAAFAASIKAVGWFKPQACNIYIVACLLGLVFNLLPPNAPELLGVAGYFTAIPAITFLASYLTGVNLLRKING